MTAPTATEPPGSRRPRWPAVVFALLASPFALALLCVALRGSFYVCDLVATVSAQLAVLCALLGLIALVCRRWAVGVATVLIALGLFLPALLAPRAGGGTDADARVLVFNAYAEGASFDRSIAMLRTVEADVVLLNELNQPFAEAIRVDPALIERYPHMQLPEDEAKWRHGILSKWPLESLEERDERWKELRFRYIYRRSVIVKRPEGAFAATCSVPASPRSAERWANGNDELRADCELINNYLLTRGVPVVVGVDLNATPTGARTGIAHRLTGLRRGKPLGAMGGTWPAGAPPLLRAAIDDVLVSEGVGVTSWRVIGGATDSDHAPVLVTLDLPE